MCKHKKTNVWITILLELYALYDITLLHLYSNTRRHVGVLCYYYYYYYCYCHHHNYY